MSVSGMGVGEGDGAECRVCLRRRPLRRLRPLEAGGGGGEAPSPRERLAQLTRLAVPLAGGLPRHVCARCDAELRRAHGTALRCIRAETALLARLARLEARVELEGDGRGTLHSVLKDEPVDEDHHYDENYYVDDEDEKPLIETLVETKEKNRKIKKKRKKPISTNTKCKLCGIITKAPSALVIHLRTHTGERPYTCSDCNKSFAQKNTLKNHLLTHLKERVLAPPTFTCEFCGKMFARKRDIVIHLRIHTGETPYACPFCPRRFKQIGTLIRHKRVHTGERPYQCEKCPKRFTDKYALNLHETTHSEERRFSCNKCGQMVKSRNALKKHLDKHTYGKRHVCDKCGVGFALKCNLQKHMERVHSEKSGICTVCEKPVPNLEEHKRRHTGQLYSCAVCNKKLMKESSLRIHSLRHLDSNKYKCLIVNCQKAFPTQTMLHYHHIKMHTKEMPYSCQHCSKEYLRLCDLTKHLRGSHKILKHGERGEVLDFKLV